MGSRRAPQFRHGGRAFPKRPRSFDFPLPHRIRQLGLIYALSTKMGQGNLFVVNDMRLEESKTRRLSEIVTSRGWDSALFITGEDVDPNLARASFGLGGVDVMSVRGLNVRCWRKVAFLSLAHFLGSSGVRCDATQTACSFH